MINPECRRCGNELDEFGSILLSPPEQPIPIEEPIPINSVSKILKSHLCKKCYDVVIRFIDGGSIN